MRGDKIALVGPNGIGQDDPAPLLNGEVKPDARHVSNGGTKRAWVNAPEALRDGGRARIRRPAKALALQRQGRRRESARLFGRLLFKKDEPLKPTKVLSGGETVLCVSLAKMMLGQPKSSADEPTNHLEFLEAIRYLTRRGHLRGNGHLHHPRTATCRTRSPRIIEMSEDGRARSIAAAFQEGKFLVKARIMGLREAEKRRSAALLDATSSTRAAATRHRLHIVWPVAILSTRARASGGFSSGFGDAFASVDLDRGVDDRLKDVRRDYLIGRCLVRGRRCRIDREAKAAVSVEQARCGWPCDSWR